MDQGWLLKSAHIELGSPWKNKYCESFNARFCDELLNGEIFYSLNEARIVIKQWRRHYNTKRPHSALGCRSPAPENLIRIEAKRKNDALLFNADQSSGKCFNVEGF